MTTRSVLIVSHTHWDREWYRPFQAFRARLVDTVDRVFELLVDDEGYVFMLDGQSIVIEDYLAIRPDKREWLVEACADKRIAIGPWWVQPDSLLPAGETHIRNLLEGRRVCRTVGEASKVAYVPDSFGHPACFPSLFAQFGLGLFVAWRGNGDELDGLRTPWVWVAPDGTRLPAYHLAEGYFSAAGLDIATVDAGVLRLTELGERLAAVVDDVPLVFMDGIDHQAPDASVGAIAERLAAQTGWDVRRGVLDDLLATLPEDLSDRPTWSGDLLGGKVANLLPGVWSSRLHLKLSARRCESVLTGWTEPLAALSLLVGGVDERPALRIAWRDVVANSAHDSIGGCSTDLVHEQMESRYADAEGLARETANRLLERLSGTPTDRQEPWAESFDVVVMNPSVHVGAGIARMPLDPFTFSSAGGREGLHPTLAAGLASRGFTVDGRPARMVSSDDPERMRVLPGVRSWDLEWVETGLPPMGVVRRTVAQADAKDDAWKDVRDAGRDISADDTRVAVADDGTFTVTFGSSTVEGVFALEDCGDRGDTYDADPLDDTDRLELVGVDVARSRHGATGIEQLAVTRTLRIPAGLTPGRDRRGDETVDVTLTITATVAPGVDRIDLDVRLDDRAHDHRLRLLVPGAGASVRAATTLGTAERASGSASAGAGWKHKPPVTFPHQGWVQAGSLVVVAPGLPEAEVRPDGTLALTLQRSVGWLSQYNLGTRPEPAGPATPTPGAQCTAPQHARLALLPATADDPGERARAAELGLLTRYAGAAPLLAAGTAQLAVAPASLVLSAFKPAESGDGVVVRVLNPTATDVDATVTLARPLAAATSVRLDETPDGGAVQREGATLTVAVPAHGWRTLWLAPA
ncbi:MAG TPA: glycosyl hydrolase-related protein [Mycobacteriales bacterium]|nr:glycosyl hydrolase-related protein [Mycobacteriales bacterium]